MEYKEKKRRLWRNRGKIQVATSARLLRKSTSLSLSALFILLILSLGGALAVITTPTTSVLESVAYVYPAPFGYTIVFNNTVPVFGYRANGVFYRLPSANTKYVVLPSVPDVIVSRSGVDFRLSVARIIYRPFVFRYRDDYVFVVPDGATIYASKYVVAYTLSQYYNYTSHTTDSVLVSNTFYPNVRELIYSTGDITVSSNSTTYTESIQEFLNISSTCIYGLPDEIGYAAGILDVPACSHGIEPIKTVRYKGLNLIVLFRIAGDNKHVIALTDNIIRALADAGFIDKVDYDQRLHVIALPSTQYYLARLNSTDTLHYVHPAKNIIDLSGPRNSTYTVSLLPVSPGKCSLVAMVVFHPVNPYAEKQYLLPGEVIVLRGPHGEYYVEHGYLDYLLQPTIADISAPPYREFGSTITISSRTPVVVVTPVAVYRVTANSSAVIPLSMVEGTTIYIISGANIYPYSVNIPSVFYSPVMFFVAVAVAGAVTYKLVSRFRRNEEYVKIIDDLPRTYSPPIASISDTMQAVDRFYDMYGYAPDVSEIAMTRVLPRLTYRGRPIFTTARLDGRVYHILMKWRLNPEAEMLLRKLYWFMAPSCWEFKRVSANHGYFYTFLGGMMFVLPTYIAGFKEKSHMVLVKALYYADKTYGKLSQYDIPMSIVGILIVSPRNTATPIKAQINSYMRSPVTPSELIKTIMQDTGEEDTRWYKVGRITEPIEDIFVYSGLDTELRMLVERVGEKLRLYYDSYLERIGYSE